MQLMNDIHKIYNIERYIADNVRTCRNLSGYAFDGPIQEDEFVVQLVFSYLMDYYVKKAERRRMMEFCADVDENLDQDSERRRLDGAMSRIIKTATKSRERLGVAERDSYIPKVMEPIPYGNGKATCRQYTKLDIMALNNSGLQIIRILKNRGICKSQSNVSGKDIFESYMEYRTYIEQASEENDAQQWLYNLFDIAQIEQNMLIAFIYDLSQYLYENGYNEKTKLPPELYIIASSIPVWTLRSSCDLSPADRGKEIQAPFWNYRSRIIPYFFDQERKVWAWEHMRQLTYWYMALIGGLKKDLYLKNLADQIDRGVGLRLLRDYFRKNYNLFSTYSFSGISVEEEKKKKFSTRRTKLIRSVSEQLGGTKKY